MKILFRKCSTEVRNEFGARTNARFVYQQANSTPTQMPAEALTHMAVAETMKTVLEMKVAPDLSGESAEDLAALQKGLVTIKATKALMESVPDMAVPESVQQQISALKEACGQQVQAALTLTSNSTTDDNTITGTAGGERAQKQIIQRARPLFPPWG